MTAGPRPLWRDLIWGALLVMGFALFGEAIQTLWNNTLGVMRALQASHANTGDAWAMAPPSPYPAWWAYILDRCATLIIMLAALATFLLPRRQRSPQEFALLTALCLGYVCFKTLYVNLQ